MSASHQLQIGMYLCITECSSAVPVSGRFVNVSISAIVSPGGRLLDVTAEQYARTAPYANSRRNFGVKRLSFRCHRPIFETRPTERLRWTTNAENHCNFDPRCSDRWGGLSCHGPRKNGAAVHEGGRPASWDGLRQVRARAAVDTRVLQQNTGRQASVLNVVRRARAALGDSLVAAMNNGLAWKRLVREVAEVVRIMPLWKLQTVGREHLDFLYANTGAGNTITLRPGVAFCFRKFHPLISDLVRGPGVG
jgi:hypothetical protein